MAKVYRPLQSQIGNSLSRWGRLREFCERNLRLVTFVLTAIIIVATISIINHFWAQARDRKAYADLDRAVTAADLLKLETEYAGTGAEARILYRLANAYYAEGNLEEAKKRYQEFKTKFGDNHTLSPFVRTAFASLENDLKWTASEQNQYLNSLFIGTTPTMRAGAAGPLGKSGPVRQDPPLITIVTSKGQFNAVLLEDEAPNATAHLIKLFEKKTFDGARFTLLNQGARVQVNARTADVPYRIGFEASARDTDTGMIVLIPSDRPGETDTVHLQILTRPMPELNRKVTVVGMIPDTKGLSALTDADMINSVTVVSRRNHPYEPSIIKE